MPPRTLPPVSELVPHDGPMLLLGRVLEHCPEYTVCEVEVERSRLFVGADGRVPVWVGVEYMAQCIAAHGGLVARALDDPVRPGLFLGTRRVQFSIDAFEAGDVLRVTARHLRGDLGLASFACRLERGAELVAEGNLSVYVVERMEDLVAEYAQ